uniref:SHS2_Rpb7-N domain-containing protein n=1 Tax=Caenorhabditis japonica TaxID=281687 RepID=A0A8R1ILJ3_CAEJA
MFILSQLCDTVAIKPHQLNADQQTVIKKRLNERLANKVVPDLGLCICVYDITEIGDSYILPGEGDCRARVTVRLLWIRDVATGCCKLSASKMKKKACKNCFLSRRYG